MKLLIVISILTCMLLISSCDTAAEYIINEIDPVEEIKGKPMKTIDSLETVIDSLNLELRICERSNR